MTLLRVAIPSPNYSARGGASVRLICLHTAEGALTYRALGNYFASSSSGVSSHAGIDDTPNEIGVYVRREHKAWTQANANPYCVSAELCAFAAWPVSEWNRHPNMLANCAAWIAEEAEAFGIPIRRLTPAEAQGGASGVCQHRDLGTWGGNHSDCGDGFPIDQVLFMAGGGIPEPEPPPPPKEQTAMQTVQWAGQAHVFDVVPDGRLSHRWYDWGNPAASWAADTLADGLDPACGPTVAIYPDRPFELHVYARTKDAATWHAWVQAGSDRWDTDIYR